MLDQIVASRSIFLHIKNQLANRIELMEARKNELPFRLVDRLAVLFRLFRCDLKAHEFLQNIEHAVLLQHHLPEIAGDIIIVPRLRVSGTAIGAGTIAPLIERQEKGLVPVQFRGHSGLIQIHGKEGQDTVVQPKSRLPRIAVIHPLCFAVVDALAGQLILQLDGNDRDAIDRQHHIHTVLVLAGIVPLPDALADILLIVSDRRLIEGGFRLEITDLEVHATMLETVAQNRHQAILLDGILKTLIELAVHIRIALPLKPLPHDGLGFLHKTNQRPDIQRHIHGRPIPRVIRLLIAARRRNQEFLYIRFKLFLIFCHLIHHLALACDYLVDQGFLVGFKVFD